MTAVVYAIGSLESSLVKIGKAGNLQKRFGEIQRMSPAPLAVLWSTPGGLALESALHSRFEAIRAYGEWFDFGKDDPVVQISAAASAFTVAAEGAEAITAELEAVREERIAAEAHLALVAAKSVALVVEALKAEVRPSIIAKRSGYTDGYVRKLRSEAGLPPDPRYSSRPAPPVRRRKSDS